MVAIPTENFKVQAPQEATETMSNNTSNKKNTYSDDFKKEVAEAAQKPGATLASVGEQFGVNPTLVRNWKIKFSEEIEMQDMSKEKKIGISVELIQSWLQKSTVVGTIDSDGDLYVSTETTSETITDEPIKLFISGTEELAAGGKNETSAITDQLTTNETNWLRSDFLKGVGSDNTQFSYNLNCDVYGSADTVTVPIKLKKGKVSECPIKAGQIELSELNFSSEDGDFRAEGTIKGPNGFIYAAEVLTEEPAEGHVPSVHKTPDDESSAEIYEFLWDSKKGDTVFVVLCDFEKLDGKLSSAFTGEAEIEEPTSYDDGEDANDFDEEKFSEYTEVVIDDEDNEQYYYWVLTDDEDEAVEAALKKHDEMGRPSAVNDEDAGIFPMAYKPVTESASESALKIQVDGTDVSDGLEFGNVSQAEALSGIVTFEAAIEWGAATADFSFDELPEEFAQAKELQKQGDDSCLDILLPFISCVFMPTNLFGDVEEVFDLSEQDDEEIAADTISISGLDFADSNIPKIKASAFFSMKINPEFDIDRLDEWQDENDMFDNAVSFEWDIETIDEDADVRSLSHEGLAFFVAL